jgi:hypothetical protein
MDLCVYQSERNLVDIRAFGDAYESIREKEILWISEHLEDAYENFASSERTAQR